MTPVRGGGATLPHADVGDVLPERRLGVELLAAGIQR